MNIVTVLRVADAEGRREYDLLFLPPEGMTPEAAEPLLNEAVRSTREDDPDGFTFEALDERLTLLGFTHFEYLTINEEW